jgi:DNA invertase Pin-like site-specific DNA recombinase
MQEKIVTTIHPIMDLRRHSLLDISKKRRVAGYARVSTDQEEQLTSYEAQLDYWETQIRANPEWEYVAVYCDEGQSATTTKNRDGFNRMIADALDGKIDLICTKSISRFARNTVDTLVTVRKLKEKGIEVWFQKENIFTLDAKGELLITIMSSLAQEESRSISENVTWGQRKRFSDGKVSMPYKHFLGYARGDDKDHTPVVVEEEATVVREIYGMFLQGKTAGLIAADLTRRRVPTPCGTVGKWSAGTVMSILRQEKYVGNARLQKQFTVDFLAKVRKKNEGEVPSYWVENSHPAIVSVEVWEMVQAEIARRESLGTRHSGKHAFSGKIFCAQCGGHFGSKRWHSTSQYSRQVWQCNNKYRNGTRCTTTHLEDKDVKRLFVEAFNRLCADRAALAEDCEEIIAALTDTQKLDKQADALAEEMDELYALMQSMIAENASTAQDQTAYKKKHDKVLARYETAKAKLESVGEEKRLRSAKREKIRRFYADLAEQQSAIAEFDEALWYAMVEQVMVSETAAAFTFRDGTVIDVNI